MGTEGAPGPVVFTAPVAGLYELNLTIRSRPWWEQSESSETEEK